MNKPDQEAIDRENLEIAIKNVAIAELFGATKEQWYPPNVDTKKTGVYMEMPNKRFFPNGERWCRDSGLKFHSSHDWQFRVINFIKKFGFATQISWDYILIADINDDYTGAIYVTVDADPKVAIFQALYEFTEYIKKNQIIIS